MFPKHLENIPSIFKYLEKKMYQFSKTRSKTKNMVFNGI